MELQLQWPSRLNVTSEGAHLRPTEYLGLSFCTLTHTSLEYTVLRLVVRLGMPRN